MKLHPSLFSEIHLLRKVNNIYLDTDNFSFYHDNLSGNKYRRKFRIRWYGEHNGFIENPVLEIKIKEGFLGDKLSYYLPSVKLSDNLTFKIAELLQKAELPDNIALEIKSLKPVVYNSYKRRYFLSSNSNFRVTVDDELHFANIWNGGSIGFGSEINRNVIVELKYESSFDEEARHVSSHFPYRFTKFSKYEEGIRWLFPALDL